jgi:nicotinamidase-related amidase
MKESYFSAGTIQAKAGLMRQQIQMGMQKRDTRFDADRSALLVLDMQSYFLSPPSHAFIPSSAAILPGIRALIQAFTARRRPVVFTRHLNTPQDAGQMAFWWRDLIVAEHPYSQIVPELDTSAGIIIPKCQYDAFYGTFLEQVLHDLGVSQVVICGVMTHLCCETTARSAFTRGFEVFFTVDGTATYNEGFHCATLLNLAHGFATLALVDEIRFATMGEHNGSS